MPVGSALQALGGVLEGEDDEIGQVVMVNQSQALSLAEQRLDQRQTHSMARATE
ncbi:hypothetical protein D3C76_864730 [compost metagenome]